MSRRSLMVLCMFMFAVSCGGSSDRAPATPTDLAASASLLDATRIDLTWRDNASNEDSFALEISPDSGFAGATVVQLPSDTQSYSATGLAPGTPYYFRLKAHNASGDSDTCTASATTTPVVRAAGNQFALGSEPLNVRGVNYYAKDAPWELFWTEYPTGQIDEELGLAHDLGMNTVRVFFPFSPSGADSATLGKLTDLIGRVGDHGLRALVTLFDGYAGHATAYDASEYALCQSQIDAIVAAVGAGNPTLLAWDVKNELDRDYPAFGSQTVQDWARAMIGHMRQVDPNHLLTIGFYAGEAGTYDAGTVNDFASDVDFLSVHYFLPEGSFEAALDGLTPGKPMLLEEFGLHTLSNPGIKCDPVGSGLPVGCDDVHSERDQAAYLNALLSQGESHGLAGFLLWTLTDFSVIQTNAQESHYCQGILKNSLTVKNDMYRCDGASPPPTDYRWKQGAETILRHYDPAVAYLDLFDSWVDLTSDSPPPGWTDNEADGGGILRGFNSGAISGDADYLLWSTTPGSVALSQLYLTVPAEAVSPLLNIDVDRYPLMIGTVSGYSIRDTKNGSNADLRVGVREGGQTSWLATFDHSAAWPQPIGFDLRATPGWTGPHQFQIVFALLPASGKDGYSATYELDSIEIRASGL